MRAALVQMTASDDPAANLAQVKGLVARAIAGGADLVLTPECSNILSSQRDHQRRMIRAEGDDPMLAALRAQARAAGVWLLIGSLGVQAGDDADGRFANRSILINPAEEIVARYDKIHLFDVNVSDSEIYRESASYRPGAQAVVAQTPWGGLGMTICYDLRFGHLHRALAQAGARILAVPAAFNHITGAAHWHVLLRARAIETGCFVLAPAQTGHHAEVLGGGKGRQTFGHSLVVAPWGEVLADAGTDPGVIWVDLDLGAVEVARARIPSLRHDRDFAPPGDAQP